MRNKFLNLYILDPNQQQPFNPQAQQQAYYPPQNYPQYYSPPNNQAPHNPPQGQPINMNQAGWTDPEDLEAKGIEFNDDSIRKAFIRKVFAILSVRKIIFMILNFKLNSSNVLFSQGSIKLNFRSNRAFHICSRSVQFCI